MKVKVYKRVVRPAIMFCLKMAALNKREETEVKMLRLSLGVTRKQRSEVWRQREGRLRWFGYS